MTVAVIGEALIDLILGEDGAFHPHLGGSPYNVAIGLARQGVEVSYLSTLSNDAFGDQFSQALQNENVRLPRSRRSLWPTSLAIVNINSDGQPAYRLYRQGVADKDTSLQEIIDNLPSDLQVLHLGSLALTPSQLARNKSLIDKVQAQGVTVSIDINIRLGASLDERQYLADVRSLIKYADIVKASDEDVSALEICPSLDKSVEILLDEIESGMLLLTKGDAGVTLYNDSVEISVPAYRLENPVDSVGAGDTFHAAFLASLLRSSSGKSVLDVAKADLAGALNHACAAAAINVSRAGCNPPTTEEVDAFIESVGQGAG